MEETRELRAFSIYRAEPTIFSSEAPVKALLDLQSKELQMGQERVFVKVNTSESPLIQVEVLWETDEEILAYTLSKDGGMLPSPHRIRNTYKFTTWLLEQSRLLFVFSPGKPPSQVRSLLGELLQMQLVNVNLDNSFFHRLIADSRMFRVEIKEATFKTPGDNQQEFSISNVFSNPPFSVRGESAFEQYLASAELSDMVITARGMGRSTIRARLSRSGRVGIQNMPDLDLLKAFVVDLHYLLGEEGRAESEW